MSNINGMMEAIESLPARGTIAEMRRAARNLVTTGRRLGASDDETRELLDMCGLTGERDTARHLDLIKPAFNPESQRVRVHVESRRKG